MPSGMNAGGVVNVQIVSDGTPVPDKFRLIRVRVEKHVNRIPTATIEILDGSAAKQDFELSSEKVLEPGAELEIKAGYGSKLKTIYKGIVTRVGIRADSNSESRLIIECRDAAVQMTVGRKNANFIKKKDSETITDLIGSYSGLKKQLASTDTVHLEMVQYYCTDWDFLLMRAEANALLVLVDDGSVDVVKPEIKGKTIDVEYGVDLISFELDTNSITQLAAVKTRTWDPKQQKVVEQVSPPTPINVQGDLPAKKLSKVVGLDEFQLQSSVTMETAELKSWGKAQQLKADFSRISGQVRVVGNSDLKPGVTVKLGGLGARFSGKAFVSGVVHTIEDGGWETEFDIGMDEAWLTETSQVSYPAATAAVASVSGLQIGKVLKLDEDPAGEHRIQVSLAVNSAKEPGIWARLSTFYASNGDDTCGSLFVPEVGDEVVLGFLDAHPAHPIVIGSLYSSKHNPWQELTADNNIKGIVTRSQMKIEFDEEKKIITVITPSKNTFTLNDEDKKIVLEDQSGNKVSLSEDGISLDSPKDITLNAKGKIQIKATGEISVDSSADVSVAGNNIANSARIGFEAKGSAGAKLKSSGQTVVKGAMVMIN